MGARLNYELIGDAGEVVCILFSNCSHPTMNAEREFERIRSEAAGPTSLVERMLALRYPSGGGNHREGDRVFWVDQAPGDRERVIRVSFYHTA